MAAATFLLGVLPPTEQVGIAGAITLMVVRLLQGLSVGGEFSGLVTYMVETAPRWQPRTAALMMQINTPSAAPDQTA